MCVCVCVCVWGKKDQKEFGISVRKEKVKRVRGICRHLCKGRRHHCVGLCKGHPHNGTYLQSLYGI